MEKGGERIATGTAFSVQSGNSNFLITNWHNVTGRNHITNEPLHKNGYCDPKFIQVWFNTETPGVWKKKSFRLRGENGANIFHEHPNGREVDVVAIHYLVFDGIINQSIHMDLANTNLAVYPSKGVSILGFPNGLTAGRFYPIWKRGHIASEPELDFENKPMFLIDATTRKGMSGAPVILKETNNAEFWSDTTDSGIDYKNGTHVKFLGIYSGRLDGDSEIGRVWKPIVIQEIIDHFRSGQVSTLIPQDSW
jgi:hypothetical protein